MLFAFPVLDSSFEGFAVGDCFEVDLPAPEKLLLWFRNRGSSIICSYCH